MTMPESTSHNPNGLAYAVVIPAFNEAATIHDIASRALEYCEHVIVVDDGSTDDTAAHLTDLDIELIQHQTNMGKAASLWDGMQAALKRHADYVITLDADGQHRPEDIPRLLAVIQESPFHIIVGSRLANKAAIPAKRYYANKIANFWIAWASGYSIEDSQSGFRIYPSRLLEQLTMRTHREHSFVFESEILIKAAKLGCQSRPVPIDAIYAVNARPSHFRGVRDITLITRMVAKELITHGLNPLGFYRAFIHDHLPFNRYEQTGWDGFAMLFLSLLLIIATAGLGLLALMFRIFRIGRKASPACNGNRLHLVLGFQLKNNLPTAGYLQRLQRALDCLSAEPDSRVLILGGVTARAATSEAKAGQQWLLEHGIAKDRILLEEHSRNTLENLKHAQPLLLQESEPVLMISHRYHLARASALASGFSIPHQLCAADKSLPVNLKNIVLVVKEAFNLHWYYTGRTWARLTRNQKMLARIQ